MGPTGAKDRTRSSWLRQGESWGSLYFTQTSLKGITSQGLVSYSCERMEMRIRSPTLWFHDSKQTQQHAQTPTSWAPALTTGTYRRPADPVVSVDRTGYSRPQKPDKERTYPHWYKSDLQIHREAEQRTGCRLLWTIWGFRRGQKKHFAGTLSGRTPR